MDITYPPDPRPTADLMTAVASCHPTPAPEPVPLRRPPPDLRAVTLARAISEVLVGVRSDRQLANVADDAPLAHLRDWIARERGWRLASVRVYRADGRRYEAVGRLVKTRRCAVWSLRIDATATGWRCTVAERVTSSRDRI